MIQFYKKENPNLKELYLLCECECSILRLAFNTVGKELDLTLYGISVINPDDAGYIEVKGDSVKDFLSVLRAMRQYTTVKIPMNANLYCRRDNKFRPEVLVSADNSEAICKHGEEIRRDVFDGLCITCTAADKRFDYNPGDVVPERRSVFNRKVKQPYWSVLIYKDQADALYDWASAILKEYYETNNKK